MPRGRPDKHANRRSGCPGKLVAKGFSLMELLVAMAIVAILAALATPIYTRHIGRTHRVAAESCMAEYANLLERWRASHLSYDGVSTSGGSGVAPPECTQRVAANYVIGLMVSAGTFVVSATPINAQIRRDASCGVLTLDQRGTRTAAGAVGVAGCW